MVQIARTAAPNPILLGSSESICKGCAVQYCEVWFSLIQVIHIFSSNGMVIGELLCVHAVTSEFNKLGFINPWIQQPLDLSFDSTRLYSTILNLNILNSMTLGFNNLEFNYPWIQLYLDSTILGFNDPWIQQSLDSKTLRFNILGFNNPMVQQNSITFGFNHLEFNGSSSSTILNSISLGFIYFH